MNEKDIEKQNIVEPNDGLTPEEEIELKKEAQLAETEEIKKEILNKLKVDNNGIPYDADRIAISNMNAVTSIANWKFNQAIGSTFNMLAQDPSRDKKTKAMFGAMAYVFKEIYENVFNTRIPWKGADNEIHQVEAESIAESLEKAMQKLAQVVTDRNLTK